MARYVVIFELIGPHGEVSDAGRQELVTDHDLTGGGVHNPARAATTCRNLIGRQVAVPAGHRIALVSIRGVA